MKLEWIEDLLAISEARSLTEAAARRHVSQPAFSRRLRAIEEQIGITLIDRTRRPARPLRAVIDHVEELRDLASKVKQLPSYLAGSTRIVIACQHALSVSFIPDLARRILRVRPEATIRVRAANRDQCLAMLMTQQADIMLAFETDELPVVGRDEFVEKKELVREPLIPVVAPNIPTTGWTSGLDGELPIIAYPDDVFLGMLMTRNVLPSVSTQVRYKRVIETAFTIAARELARAGVGVAWIPESIAREDLLTGRLVVLPARFKTCVMSLVALRLRAQTSDPEESAWNVLLNAS